MFATRGHELGKLANNNAYLHSITSAVIARIASHNRRSRPRAACRVLMPISGKPSGCSWPMPSGAGGRPRDVVIAQVSQVFVSKLRKGASDNGYQMKPRKVKRSNTVYEMSVWRTGHETSCADQRPCHTDRRPSNKQRVRPLQTFSAGGAALLLGSAMHLRPNAKTAAAMLAVCQGDWMNWRPDGRRPPTSRTPARINRCCFVQERPAGSAGFFRKFSKTAIDRQVIWRTD
jgi:hypothetical protein